MDEFLQHLFNINMIEIIQRALGHSRARRNQLENIISLFNFS